MWKLLLATIWYTWWKCGPLNIYCNVSAMCYINRFHHMPNDSFVKQVYNELVRLHPLGFITWITHVSETDDTYLKTDSSPAEFESENRFINIRREQVQAFTAILSWEPVGVETYLYSIKNYKYGVAVSLFRINSNTLAIKYGRYTRPKTKIEDRNCLGFLWVSLSCSRHMMRDILSSNAPLMNLKKKLYSQNWYT